MDPIKEALTFDDVTLAPKYSEILPSQVDTSTYLRNDFKINIPLLSSAMDTVTESKMAIAIAKAGGIGVIHRNLTIDNQIKEIKKVQSKNLKVGAAVGAGDLEYKRALAILKEKVDMIVVDTAHGHTKKVKEIIKKIKKNKNKKTLLCAGNIATPDAAKFLIKLFLSRHCAKNFISSSYLASFISFLVLSSYLSTSAFIRKSAILFVSINSFVDITFITGPNNPSKTSLCVSVPSRVPVNPNLQSQFSNFVIIFVRELALNKCASSPITTSN